MTIHLILVMPINKLQWLQNKHKCKLVLKVCSNAWSIYWKHHHADNGWTLHEWHWRYRTDNKFHIPLKWNNQEKEKKFYKVSNYTSTTCTEKWTEAINTYLWTHVIRSVNDSRKYAITNEHDSCSCQDSVQPVVYQQSKTTIFSEEETTKSWEDMKVIR